MTTAIAAAHGLPRREKPPRHDWSSALLALRRLIADPEDSSQTFQLLWALYGRAPAEDYARLLDTPEGGRIAYERAELADKLMDPSWTQTFPPGSVGAAYLDYINRHHFSMKGLLDESHKGIPPAELDAFHPYAWWFRRIRDVHDIWHVLTGYGRDHLGEVCLQAFSYREAHGIGRALVVFGGFVRCRGPARWQARRAILEASALARRCVWLPALDYEALMFEPLQSARARLGLAPPKAYLAVPEDQRDLMLESPR